MVLAMLKMEGRYLTMMMMLMKQQIVKIQAEDRKGRPKLQHSPQEKGIYET